MSDPFDIDPADLSHDIGEVIDIGLAQPAHERIPRHVARAWDRGILALCVGIGNWGISWAGAPYDPPADPAGEDWAGQPPKEGKHLLDGTIPQPWGGFGLCHLDSGGLRSAQRHFGGAPDTGALSFNQILKTEGLRSRWLSWATRALAERESHEWLIAYWHTHHWRPCLAACKGDAERATINVRISNSLGASKARQVAGRSWAEQVEYYVAEKAKKSVKAAARARRQAKFAERCIALREIRPLR